MPRMLCLANSIRHDGRCVAGIDLDTGEWIRPVPPGGGGIPNSRTHIGGQPLSVLDIVELNVDPPLFNTRFQRENHEMPTWDWRIVGRGTPQQAAQFCDHNVPILHTDDDRVSPDILDALPPQRWQSLQLVQPHNLRFEQDYFDQNRWRARFEDAAGNEYYLKVTDPEASARLRNGEALPPECLLTISLVEPWSPNDDQPERCYKLVATVIEL